MPRSLWAGGWAVLSRAWPALLFLPMLLAPPVNHDVAAVLSFAERWLAGERLYVDLIDVNPPLVFVLNLVPAGLARATGLDGIVALQACLLVLGFAVWALAVAVRERAHEGAVERAVLDVLPGLVAFGSGYDFGQRETLMAALAVPYLLVAAQRMEGGPFRARLGVWAAVAAAVGFALKPHFLVVPALVEAAVLVARWRAGAVGAALRDPVPWAMAAVWALYAASLPVVFPDYLGSVVPLVMDYYLDNGGQTPWGLLAIPRLGTVVLMLVPLVVLAWGGGGALPRVLALAGLGALVSALAQHKGWSYHIMPIELFACSLAILLAARWLDGLRAGGVAVGWGRTGAVRAGSGLCALFAFYLVAEGEAPWNQIGWRQSDAYALTRMLREHAAGGRVLVLSPGIAPIYPSLNYAQARMTLRTMNIWLLEGAYRSCPESGRRYREAWEMGRPEFFMYRSVAEDFARAPPAAVVIDSQSAIADCGGEAFSLEAYYARHPLFAEVWSHYAEVGRHGRYVVHARRD